MKFSTKVFELLIKVRKESAFLWETHFIVNPDSIKIKEIDFFNPTRGLEYNFQKFYLQFYEETQKMPNFNFKVTVWKHFLTQITTRTLYLKNCKIQNLKHEIWHLNSLLLTSEWNKKILSGWIHRFPWEEIECMQLDRNSIDTASDI